MPIETATPALAMYGCRSDQQIVAAGGERWRAERGFPASNDAASERHSRRASRMADELFRHVRAVFFVFGADEFEDVRVGLQPVVLRRRHPVRMIGARETRHSCAVMLNRALGEEREHSP